jgi:RNA-directed DNA polymerase
MTVKITGASLAPNSTWQIINWSQVNKEVKRLQMRIAKATSENRHGKVKALQWLLSHSFSAKALAVKRVTSNSGAKTPGVDGVILKTPESKMEVVRSMRRHGYKPKPLRRIYIPKKQKGSRPPLSIPCLIDRSMQMLHLLALEPVMETTADKNTYGFRPKRSCADATQQCCNALARKTSDPFVLEGDIKACFDSLSGRWLEDNILMDKVILAKWLRAGYIEGKTLHPTYDGTSQGSPISPAILVLALKGLEEAIKTVTFKRDKVHLVAYADDFVITGNSKEVLENKVMPAVSAFLKERGLELSLEKTKITHVDEGFDFLGHNIRKYKGKLLIKPSKANVKAFLNDIRKTIKSHKTVKTEELIWLLNPKIRGWTNYFRHVVSKETFGYADNRILKSIMQWVNRRHPTKSARWKYRKYFRTQGMRRWIFSALVKNKQGKSSYLDLFRASQLPIRRHIKIRAEANPYYPEYANYFRKRESARIRLRIMDREFLKPKTLRYQDSAV